MVSATQIHRSFQVLVLNCTSPPPHENFTRRICYPQIQSFCILTVDPPVLTRFSYSVSTVQEGITSSIIFPFLDLSHCNSWHVWLLSVRSSYTNISRVPSSHVTPTLDPQNEYSLKVFCLSQCITTFMQHPFSRTVQQPSNGTLRLKST